LLRGPRGKLTSPRSGGKVLVSFVIADPPYLSLHADLFFKGRPPKTKGNIRILDHLFSLPALEIGVKDETSGVHPLEEHHSDRRFSSPSRGRQRKSVGESHSGSLGSSERCLESTDRIPFVHGVRYLKKICRGSKVSSSLRGHEVAEAISRF
jgi:hypothetical protein